MRTALEHALPHVREQAFSVAPTSMAPVTAPLAGGPRRRRRGRPPATEKARRLVHLQKQARVVLEEAPDMDEESLRRVLVSGGVATLGLPENSPLFDQAIRAVFDNPDNRPPQPTGEDRPPD